MKYYSLFLLCLVIFSHQAEAQSAKSNKKENNSLLFPLNEDGSHYVKGTFLNQIWFRYNQSNPGSTVFGEERDKTFDIGLRRTRIQLFGQLSDKVFFYTQFGQNNLSYRSPRKQGIFFLDAIGEYRVWGEQLSIGGGLTGWNGVTRYASPSIGSILSLDAPLYQQGTNDINDQFVRKFSIYAKGLIGKLDYRVVVSDPMSIQQSTGQEATIEENALFAAEQGNAQFQGYFKYQFWDTESNLTPYQTGSYLGKKKVFNIGAGFMTQKDAMWNLAENGVDTVRSSLGLFAVDLFYDRPIDIAKGNAITFYAAYQNSDYGKNYVRNIGAMNPANGVNGNGSFNGPGSAFPTIGTGDTFFAQGAYLFRRDLLGSCGTLQPYVSSQYSQFDLLDDPMLMYEGGINWLINGHRTKLSLNYQNRPIFVQDVSEGNGWISNDRKGMVVMQFQVSL